MDPLFLLFMVRNMIQHLIGMMRRGSFKTLRPVFHILTWTPRWVFLWVSLLGKKLFHASLKNWWWDIVILLCSCWNLGYCMIDHVVMLVLEHFWSVYFCSWCNLDNVGGLWNFDNVGSLWCCWMNFGLVWEHWHCEKFVLWACMNMFMMYVEKFVGMCKLCFKNVAKCGYVHG